MIKKSEFILAFTVVLLVFTSTFGQKKKLVKEWVDEDVEGVSSILGLIPFEQQDIEKVKARLRKDWHVEETNLGFGAKYLELEKGRGYSKGYVHSLIYNGQVAQYEAGIESYSEEWPQIKQRIYERWKADKGPESFADEHGLVFKRTLSAVLSRYKADVADTLGPLSKTLVPSDLSLNYSDLINPMENSTLSGTHPNEAIESLVNAKRIDLLENVLRGYNPGARMLASLALLRLEKTGVQLSSKTHTAIDRVMNLNIHLHSCVYDMCSDVTAKEAMRWFDSGLAWPKLRLPQKKP